MSASSSTSLAGGGFHDGEKYEVFISFRGSDVRHRFLSHLFAALQRKQVHAFIDDHLERGKDISGSLIRIIGESDLSIVVFSQNYPKSEWCLEELEKIHESMKKKKRQHTVVPVFYEVDPSDVQNLKGNYGKIELQKLRDATVEISNLSGFHSSNSQYRNDAELIDAIVLNVSMKLSEICPTNPQNDGLFGIESSLKDVESLLCIDSINDVRMVGIWGMGGIGKTTIARTVFDRIKKEFHGHHCFVSNVREAFNTKDGVEKLRNKIIHELLGDNDLNKFSSDDYVWRRIKRIKVLVVLDDVDTYMQLKSLLENIGLYSPDSFCPGSRILVTSRDSQVLRNVKMKSDIYEAKQLNDIEALKLFSWHAFGLSDPQQEYEKEERRTIITMHDLIEQMGQEIVGEEKERQSRIWEFDDIRDVLSNKRGTKHVEAISSSYYWYDEIDINPKAFIPMCKLRFLKLDWNLHCPLGLEFLPDSIRYLNWRYYPLDYWPSNHNPEKLVELHLFYSGLKELVWNKPLKNLKRLHLSSSMRLIRIPDLAMAPNLEVLDLSYCTSLVEIGSSLENLKKLAILDVSGCINLSHLSELPRSIVDLRLGRTGLRQLPATIGGLTRFKSLWLHSCKSLESLPNSICNLISLEVMNLSGCSSLVEIGSSLENLKKLTLLDVSGCTSLSHLPELPCSIVDLRLGRTGLRRLPATIGCLSHLKEPWLHLENLPTNICNLTSLESLNLSKSGHLQKLPDDFGNLESLKELDASCSGLRELPSSIRNLKKLVKLRLTGCSHLRKLPDDFGDLESLQELDASYSSLRELPLSIRNLKKLVYLNLGWCKDLESLRVLPSNLEELDVRECKSLEIVPTPFLFPKTEVNLFKCCRLKLLAPSITEEYLLAAEREPAKMQPSLWIDGNEVPKWMKHRNNLGNCLYLNLPTLVLPISFIFCIVVTAGPALYFYNTRAIITHENGLSEYFCNGAAFLGMWSSCGAGDVLLWNGIVNRAHIKAVSFESNGGIIKECGVHPIYQNNNYSKRKHQEDGTDPNTNLDFGTKRKHQEEDHCY